jgi:hypothetical protein
MEVGSVEENVLRCVRYNEVALLNGCIDHSQNSLNVENYCHRTKKKSWGGVVEHIRFTIHITAKEPYYVTTADSTNSGLFYALFM